MRSARHLGDLRRWGPGAISDAVLGTPREQNDDACLCHQETASTPLHAAVNTFKLGVCAEAEPGGRR
jgi:hypothetical protein